MFHDAAGREYGINEMPDQSLDTEAEDTADFLSGEYLKLSQRFVGVPDIRSVLQQRISERKRSDQEYYLGTPTTTYELCGFRNLKQTIEEIEMLCRHALATDADNLIFLDQSARRYGEVVHKILPVMKLECARITGREYDTIKLPRVLFVNPPLDPTVVAEKLGQALADSTSVIFDESSGHISGIPLDPIGVKPSDQYDFYNLSNAAPPAGEYLPDSKRPYWNDQRLDSAENDADWDRKNQISRIELAKRKKLHLEVNRDHGNLGSNQVVFDVRDSIRAAIPSANIETHVGLTTSQTVGGNLQHLIGTFRLGWFNLPIQDPSNGVFSSVDKDHLLVRSLPGRNDGTNEQEETNEEQQRKLLDMIGRAIFDDVTVKSLSDLKGH